MLGFLTRLDGLSFVASGTEAKNGGQSWIGDCHAIPRLRFAPAQTICLTADADSAVVRTQLCQNKESVHRNDERFSKKMVGRAGLAIAMQSPDSASLRLKPFASPLMRIRQWFEPSSARTKKAFTVMMNAFQKRWWAELDSNQRRR